MQFKKAGFGPMAVMLWDTAWTPEKKTQTLHAMDGETRLTTLDRMVGERTAAEVQPDWDLVLSTTVGAIAGWTRIHLHRLRALLAGLNTPQYLQTVDNALRASVRPSDTGGSPPQKKTPAGMTRVLNINYRLQAGKRSDVQFQHAQFFAGHARELGLRLCILTTLKAQQDLLSSGVLDGLEVQWGIADEVASEWAEDSVEFLQSGVVAVLDEFVDSALRAGLVEGRRARWQGLVDPPYESEVFDADASKGWVAEGLLVNAGRTRQTRTDVLTKQHGAVAHLRFYAEGGNLIVGEDTTGRTVVLVGRDAIAATRGEYAFTDDAAVTALIAEDFGLARDQVIAVEQPGTFHLDMGLLFLGHGQVVVNDGSADIVEAERRLARFDTDGNRKFLARLRLRSGLENLAAKDLASAGMKVLRHKLESGENCNFFNGEFVADGGGRVHYLTNGASAEKKPITDLFSRLLIEDLKVAASLRMTPPAAAEVSLKLQGGVGCRAKGAPSIR